MTTFAMGFVFLMIFTGCVGVGAVIFLYYDAEPSTEILTTSEKLSTNVFAVVRHVNTQTIETVNKDGLVQTWVQSDSVG